MENQELIKQVTEKAQRWLTPAYDAETQAEVKRMLENEDKTELIEAFYKDLEFGTGGLRGIMGVGSNRMNIYTVGAATQGLSNYLKKNFKDLPQISVVVGHDCRNNSRLRYPSPRLPERYYLDCFSQSERIQRLQSILG